MEKQEKYYSHIERRYILTAKELKDRLEIEGEISNVNLWKGRSPDDIDKGKSSDLDEWEIKTIEQGFDGKIDKVGTKLQVKQQEARHSSQA